MSLIERIEGAEGPDRELDCLIADLVGAWPENWTRQQGVVKPGQSFVLYWNQDKLGEWMEAPAYTASIDAAMTLVPEGYHLQLGDWTEPALTKRGAWHAILSQGIRGGSVKSLEGSMRTRCQHAVTPALALCAAALKARASDGEAGE